MTLERLACHVSTRALQIAVHLHIDGMTEPEVAELIGISDRAVRKAMAEMRTDAVAALGAGAQLPLREESADEWP